MRTNAIIPMSPTADHTGKEGYFVENSSGQAAICNAATDIPLGVITEGAPVGGMSSIALPALGEITRVKVTATSPGTITVGTYLTLKSDGTVQADAGSGARVRVARATEDAVAGELVAAYLVEPTALS